MPILLGLAIYSESVIRLLLTDKWLPSVSYMMIFCISYSFYPFHAANLNGIKALEKSNIFLRLEIV